MIIFRKSDFSPFRAVLPGLGCIFAANSVRWHSVMSFAFLLTFWFLLTHWERVLFRIFIVWPEFIVKTCANVSCLLQG